MNAIQNNENLAYLKLNVLFLSTLNVRTVSASKEDDKQLKASINALGILQSLTVVKEGKKFGVIGGGRRLEQLCHLAEDGEIATDYLVPCLIKNIENSSISAISLSENIKAKMHPADEFIAFERMVNEGKTIASIAHEFGITQILVKKRLKMATVAPTLIDAYREGKIDLEDIMVFTVTDDQQRQLDCYNELKPHHLHSYRIKQYLLDQTLSTEEPIVKLVTIQAYKKAGGSITNDLFESSSYINDRELLETLALERLNKKAATLRKQWKWVEVSLSHNRQSDYETTLTPEPIDVPDSVSTAIKEKEKALNALNKIDFDQWTDEQEALENRLENELHALEKKVNKCRRFTDEQKRVSGAVVTISHDGKIVVDVGFVKKEDMPEAFPNTHKNTSSSNARPELPVNVESQALTSDLMNYKLQAFQSHLMKDDKLAYDLMVFSIASCVLNTGRSDKPIAVTLNQVNYSSTIGIDETKATKSINNVKESLDIAWLSHSTNAEKFAAFQQLSSAHKKKILTYCTALSYHFTVGIDEPVLESTNFKLINYWKPTEDTYYKRVTTNRLLEIGKSEIGQEWESKHRSLTKGKLVEQLSQHKKMSEWMPESVL